jgi:3-ketosteroid 9alpha-monooxygenase subunit B
VTVELDGESRVLDWQPGQRLLDVLLAAGLDAPYSCREGHCGSCCCQLVAGQVEMVNNEVLDEADLADGYILACQSVAVTPQVSIVY